MADEKEICKEDYNLKNLILYKMDRTLAIGGLIVIGIFAMYAEIPAEAAKIATGVVGALAVYVGGRTK